MAQPQQWHGYSYANNNPITLSDPTGLIPCGDNDCKITPPRNPGSGNGNGSGDGSGNGNGGGNNGGSDVIGRDDHYEITMADEVLYLNGVPVPSGPSAGEIAAELIKYCNHPGGGATICQQNLDCTFASAAQCREQLK